MLRNTEATFLAIFTSKKFKNFKNVYFQLKKKKKKKRDRDFSIISVGRERAIKQVFFLGLSAVII